MSLPPLSPGQLVKPRHFELRIGLLFAALFIPAGIHLPYFPLWLEANGFGAEQIAVILAAPMFLRVVTTPFITAIADRAKDRANVLVLVVAASLLMSLGYFLPPSYATVLGVSLALSVFMAPHPPLTDSLALSGVRRFGSNYAKMRIWGSTSFLCANLGGGIILSATSAEVVPIIISIGFCGTLLASFLAPRLGPPRRASPLSAAGLHDAAPKLMNRFFVLSVAGAGLINASHAFLFGFISIYWKSIGVGETVVGFLWAFAVVSEVGMFMVFTRFTGRVSTSLLLALAGLFSIIRWTAFPLIWPLGLGVPGFFAVQALHSFSTGLILIGVQKLIVETVPEERMGAAQGIAYFANGFAMATATLLSGPLYELLGVNGLFVMSDVAAAGLVLIGLAAKSAPERVFRR
jgi:PPP family 3-phenylpropionic acid transporter